MIEGKHECDQIAELQGNRNTQREQQYLTQCDGWVRPWAVRAVSGHSGHPDSEQNLVELDPDRFAISPSRTLMNELGGAYHATSCRHLQSIAERGILPGASIEVTYGSRHEAGRLHSCYGIFPPWDQRNTTTRTRVSGRETGTCHWSFSTHLRRISFDKGVESLTAATSL